MADDQDHTIVFRQILVAVDTSAHSQAALEAAASLAKLTEADIRGLFVQEEHWDRVSRIPSIKAVNVYTGETQLLKEDSLRQQIDVLKSRLRRQLKEISRRHQINHSWETTQGRVAEKILEAAKDSDLITIGRRGQSFLQQKQLGSTAKAIIGRAEKPVLVLQKGLRLGKTISAVYDTSAESQRGLKLALSLARKNESKLSIIVLDHGQQNPAERDKSIERMLDNALVPVKVTTLRQPNIGRFIHALNSQHSGLTVIPKNQAFLQNDSLETTLEYVNCPVLIMN